ncbi:MAG TPA: hypothetical protein VE075_01960 [Thermoanaerobaculia bacterium]|nr:hypothetical protein [Thermoanaerobaculia bacterium]
MKKKQGSKATLNRETLRNLDSQDIETAVGGLSVKATCTCCNTTRLTCSTRLC